ncbi:MAG: hypothetical protein NTW19_01390 [Planctomycetota bacterium]|nr:hypothetical protein [Planctomycetota bacterium]
MLSLRDEMNGRLLVRKDIPFCTRESRTMKAGWGDSAQPDICDRHGLTIRGMMACKPKPLLEINRQVVSS